MAKRFKLRKSDTAYKKLRHSVKKIDCAGLNTSTSAAQITAIKASVDAGKKEVLAQGYAGNI